MHPIRSGLQPIDDLFVVYCEKCDENYSYTRNDIVP